MRGRYNPQTKILKICYNCMDFGNKKGDRTLHFAKFNGLCKVQSFHFALCTLHKNFEDPREDPQKILQSALWTCKISLFSKLMQ